MTDAILQILLGHDGEEAPRLCVVDVETTGFSTKDRITEVGWASFRLTASGQAMERRQGSCLVDPGIPIPFKIAALTNINDLMVKGEPSWGEHPGVEVLRNELTGSVMIGHNISFDRRMMWTAWELAALEPPRIADQVCTVKLAKARWPGQGLKHNLAAVCKRIGIKQKNAHRAVGDVIDTNRVLLSMVREAIKERDVEIEKQQPIIPAKPGPKDHIKPHPLDVKPEVVTGSQEAPEVVNQKEPREAAPVEIEIERLRLEIELIKLRPVRTPNLDRQMAKAQAMMKPAKKSSHNKYHNSDYADLSAIIESVRPALSACGIGYTQNISNEGRGPVGVETILFFEGEERRSSISFPIITVDNKGDKKGKPIQILGGTISYLRRYALTAACGQGAGDDNDGNEGQSSQSYNQRGGQPHYQDRNQRKPAPRKPTPQPPKTQPATPPRKPAPSQPAKPKNDKPFGGLSEQKFFYGELAKIEPKVDYEVLKEYLAERQKEKDQPVTKPSEMTLAQRTALLKALNGAYGEEFQAWVTADGSMPF